MYKSEIIIIIIHTTLHAGISWIIEVVALLSPLKVYSCYI